MNHRGVTTLPRGLNRRMRHAFIAGYHMLLAFGLSACSMPPLESQEKPTMPATDVASSTADTANPTLSAEEVGRRFLKLIESLKSPDDINEELVKSVMGLTLEPAPDGPAISQPLGGDWYFVVYLVPESPVRKKGVFLDFINEKERFADMSALCGLSFEDYHNALKAMGYQEEFLYDQIDGQVGRLLGVEYRKDALRVGIMPEVKRFSNGKFYPTCVRSIRL